MTDKYCCDGEVMGSIKVQLKSVKNDMLDAYDAAKKIKDDIDSEEYWKSDSQKTMAAFLDLLTQYHKDFIKGDNAPLGKAVDQLKALQTALGSFYEDWDAHTELETIE